MGQVLQAFNLTINKIATFKVRNICVITLTLTLLELGFIIENRVMHSTFHEKLKQFPNVEIYHESPVEHVSIPSSDFRVP